MRRHGVRGNFGKARDFTGGNAIRLATDKAAECFQPSRLGESGKGRDDVRRIHISRLMELYDERMTRFAVVLGPTHRDGALKRLAAQDFD